MSLARLTLLTTFVAVCTGPLSLGMTRFAAATEAAVKSKFLLEEEPEDPTDVIAFRKAAKDQNEAVVVGRIGGRKTPWVKNAAAFSIVDRSLKPCNEIEGDNCPAPWDYCCENNLPKATVLVMLVDDAGKLVREDARKLLGVKELQTVVVQGKAKRDKAGNVTLMASKIFVRSDKRVLK
jgi:hypothetical protein